MRRLLRYALFSLVVASLVLPAPISEATSLSMPICCLGKGEHECMGHMLGGDSELPGMSAAVDECPYAPLALTATHLQPVAPPVSVHLLAVVETSAPLEQEGRYSSFSVFVSDSSQRGPPAISLN